MELPAPPTSRWWSRTCPSSSGKVFAETERSELADGRWRASMAQQRGRDAAAAASVRRGHDIDRERVGGVARAAGEQRHLDPACDRLLSRMLIFACRALLGRLWDHFFDYGVSLYYPFTSSGKLNDGREAQFKECDRGSWNAPTAHLPRGKRAGPKL